MSEQRMIQGGQQEAATDRSGERDPQKRISKEGDEMLRSHLVGSAHYILGPFGSDSDLRLERADKLPQAACRQAEAKPERALEQANTVGRPEAEEDFAFYVFYRSAETRRPLELTAPCSTTQEP